VTAWAYYDSDSLPAGIARALERAIPREPTTDPRGFADAPRSAAVRDLRALLSYCAITTYAAAQAGPPLEPASSFAALPAAFQLLKGPASPGAYDCTGPISFDAAHPSVTEAARTVNNAWHALAVRTAKSRGDTSFALPFVHGFTVRDGAAPEPLAARLTAAPPTAGSPILAMIAVVAGAAALAYLGAHAVDAVERHLAREADSRRLVALTAASTQVLGQHAQADQTAGKSTPLSAAEQRVLDALAKQLETYKATAPAPPEPAPPFDANKAVSTASTSILLPLVFVAGLFLLRK